MKNNLANILSESKPTPEEEELLNYVDGKLDAQARHEVEAAMNDDPFTSDAAEGLQAYSGRASIETAVSGLNKQLKKNLRPKRRRSGIQNQSWTYVAIIVLLLMAVLAYIVIKKISS